MARIVGATNYTRDQVKFIINNWKKMSDKKLSEETGIPISSVQRCRTRHGLSRYTFSVRTNETKAKICELFRSGLKISEICGIIGTGNDTINRVLKNCLFGTPHTENTEVRTFQSAINEM